MKKIWKITRIVLLVLVLGITGLLAYLKLALPNVGAPEEIVVERSPERIARGKYLAHHVTVCMDCHSTRDWNKFSGPPVEGTLGKGEKSSARNSDFPENFSRKTSHLRE